MADLITDSGDNILYSLKNSPALPADGVAMIEVSELLEDGGYHQARIGGGDINTNTGTLHKDVKTVPEDYKREKYLYDGVAFLNNPGYIDPAG
ncbi:MAG: hypothetical protein V3U75_13565 [Methylococcaceae bacterium]